MDDYFALYRKQKAATIERIRNSAEYQQQCTAARMATNQQQLDFDEAYTKAKEEYDSVLLPRYQAARSAWETEHQAQIRKEEQELAQAQLHRDHVLKYFDALRQQSGAPYRPPEAEACEASLHLAEQEIAQLQGQLTALGDPVFLDARLDEIQASAAHLQEDYAALEIAIEALQQADAHLHARFSPQLSQLAETYFRRLTQGRFTQVCLDRSLAVTVREEGSLADHPLALLSQGTTDQLYLALRLAVAELVLPDPQACPLILDDALLSFDDHRLATALSLLTQLAETRQILLFTCQHRELDQLQDHPGLTVRLLPGF